MIATAIVAVPLAAAVFCALSGVARWATIAASTIVVALAILTLTTPATALKLSWALPFGASYAVTVDPLSAIFIALCGVVSLAGAAASDRVGDRRAYFALWCVALACVNGVFIARDLALLFAFWETGVVAVAILVRGWGGRARAAATAAFLAHMLVGSGLFLLAMASIAVARGTLDMDALAARPIAAGAQLLPALLFLAAFAPALPLLPFHSWAPRVYAAAPVPVAILVAANIAAAAVYGIFRVCLGLFPDGMTTAAPVLVVLCAVGTIYGALVSLREDEVRRLIAYAALAQQSLVGLAIFAATATSLRGAVLGSLSHGLVVTASLLLAGALARRTASPLLSRAGGLAIGAPVLAAIATITMFAALGVPGTAGFAARILSLAGAYERFPAAAATAAFALLIPAAYLSYAIRRAYHGPALVRARDLEWSDRFIVVPLLALTIAIGVAPRIVTDHLGDDVLPAAVDER